MTESAISPASSAQAARTTDWVGVALVGSGGVCFSASIVFIRLIDGLNVMTITFYRSLFAFLFFVALMILRPRFREPLHISRYRPHIPFLVGLGVVMTLTASLYTYAIQHTTAANAALLVNSAPLYVAILSPWLLKEDRPRFTWPSLGLAVIGVILITGPGQISLESAEFGGLAAGALSGAMYSLPMLIGRHLRSHVSGVTQITWGSGITALLLLPFAFRSDFGVALRQMPLLVPLGIISLGLSYFLMFTGLRRIKAQIASIAALMEPVSGVFIGIVFFAEYLTPLSGAGTLLILASMVLISR